MGVDTQDFGAGQRTLNENSSFAPRVPALPRINAQQNFGGPTIHIIRLPLRAQGSTWERDGLEPSAEPRAVPYFHLSTKTKVERSLRRSPDHPAFTFSTLSKERTAYLGTDPKWSFIWRACANADRTGSAGSAEPPR